VFGFLVLPRWLLVASVARFALSGLASRPNKRMHATRDTNHVIERKLAGGRVMRGVRLLLRYNPLLIELAA